MVLNTFVSRIPEFKCKSIKCQVQDDIGSERNGQQEIGVLGGDGSEGKGTCRSSLATWV